MILKNSKKYNNHIPSKLYKTLDEGLIMSYDFNKCKNFLLNKFSFIKSIDSTLIHPLNGKRITMNGPSHFYYIKIDKEFIKYKQLEKTLNNLCGWYISKATLYYKDTKFNNPNVYILKFDNLENGFIDYDFNYYLDDLINKEELLNIKIIRIDFLCQEKFTDNVNDIPDFLYHGTQKENLIKIKKYGLIPKNKGNHPERIYLGDSERIIYQLFDNKPIQIVRIRINDAIKDSFYVDYNHNNCYYTHECIDPKYIDVKLNGKWISIKNIIFSEKKL